ncbi:sensor histidine kinase [Jeotgalibacillus aurantiacus]|uniref:sensor histidine kinase n=1 Tax=Jeotgalibacillus aurantiacus TaxID=2763266 RepID=UPI001D0AF19D|nr:sensor histidine kinase [Jeotgalibacillus aurantiacus]
MATFRTRARAVDLLGKQQIRDEVTAISELLRNSYDADANFGTIDIDTTKNQIIISDDGEGMTRIDIEEKWLTLGTHSKTNSFEKTRKGRVKIGEKGIGRLAISLLGDQLLLVSKRNSEWSILYLHWELFRNENMFLEDINLPVKKFGSFKEIIGFIENEFSFFKNKLLENFSNEHVWNKDIVRKVSTQIEEYTISNKVKNELYKIEQMGSGTVFHISHMEYMWNWDSFLSKTKDKSMERRHARLLGTLYSFENPFARFGMKDDQNEMSFIPSIIINGFNLRDQTWFSEEDINFYDYSIKGEICNGRFSGVCKVKYSESNTEEFNVKNVVLTQGLDTNNIKDCGPLSINWFFVEGEQHNSALSKDSHKSITEKLKKIGGIYVFRDGLRILPYGEPGNDYLELEAQRSNRASTFPFSFRRMFGYIEISKKDNNKLVDKSSREGFIENQQYLYFKEVTFNMLEWWAYDFLETKDERKGRRKARLKRFEIEKGQLEAQKQEENRQKKYLKEIQKKVKNNSFDLKKMLESFENEFESILDTFRENVKKENINFRKYIGDSFINLRLKSDEIIDSINSLEITPNLRYTLPNTLLESIDQLNSEIKKEKARLEVYFQEVIQKEIDSAISRYEKSLVSDNATVNDVIAQIDSLESEIESISRIMENIIQINQEKIIEELNSITNSILSEYNRNLKVEFEYFEEEYQTLSLSRKELTFIKKNLKSGDLFTDFSLLLDEAKYKIEHIKKKKLMLQQKLFRAGQAITSKQFHRKTENTIKNFNNIIDNVNYTDDQLIGILKKEVDMYRDISAVGLAAELTSHEFNALYQEIKRNYKILDSKLKNTSLSSVLQKSNNAFRSLERLHTRMSPLYRQSRNVKSEIKLNKFIDTLMEYFYTDIKRYNIKIINEIPESIVIKEVESVLFTPLVNIISNSIYWLLNQENRQIHFYMDSEKLRLFIQDTGPGINLVDVPFVFEPYFTKKVGGRGLGLFLSRDILEHNGHSFFAVNSNDTLKNLSGACFCIEFSDKVAISEVNQND